MINAAIAPAPSPNGERASRIALIVAIADYAEWSDINSDRDVPLLQGALAAHGFGPENVTVMGEGATREDILRAFRSSLIEPAAEGDVVFFHYSGHGVQITDDNAEEIDGYDEALVPYDVPVALRPGYAGERHIRDDELGALLAELRQKVGPTGNVIVSVDACFSGGITRGEAPVRRSGPPIGEPSAIRPVDEPTGVARGASSGGGGLWGDIGPTRAQATDGEGRLAPFVVFSASRHNELAQEAKDHQGLYVGSLSLALSKALAQAKPGSTYRTLFAGVENGMTGVTNTPQAEGNLDAQIFDGSLVAQRPFFEVDAVYESDGEVRLGAGSLHGLIPPTEVEFHRRGTESPTPQSRIARGSVIDATPTRSLVSLDGSTVDTELETAWVFVTRQAFGDLIVSVDPSALSPALGAEISSALDGSAAARVTDGAADLRLEEADGLVQAFSSATGVEIGERYDARRRGWSDLLVEDIQGYGRNRYLRALSLTTPTLDVSFEIVPVEAEVVEDRLTGARSCRVTGTMPNAHSRTEGNVLELAIGDFFILDIRNDGTRDAWVSVLDLMPNGRVGVLWPHANRAEDNLVPAQTAYRTHNEADPVCYRVSEPTGAEMLKLVATQEPIDFHLISSRTRGPGTSGNELMDLFQDVLTGVRADTPGFVPVGGITTFARTLSVVRGDR